MEKICRVCGTPKYINEFHKKKGTSDGHRNECKECVKDIQRKYKEAPGFKEKQKEYDKNRYKENSDKILERKKEYHKENREKILLQKEQYRNDPVNLDRIKEYLINYRIENKDKLKEWRQNNKSSLAKNQENYRINNPHIVAWRSVLYSTLKRLGTEKQGHTIDILGYSALDLKEHIENQFESGMSWDNHGEWHIDHVKGVINFDSDIDVKIVCALDNLRPLWATTREVDGVIYEGNLNRPKYE